MNKKALGFLCAFGANFIFGLSFLFSKITLKYAPPLVVLGIRFTVAFLFMSLLWAVKIVKIDLRGKKLLPLLFMGISQPLLYFLFEMYGISLTSSALSGTVISLVPVAVMFISLFLKEKPTPRQFVFGLLALFGVAAISFLSDDGSKNTVLGIALLFGAVASSASFNLLSSRCAAEFSAVERTYIMFAIGAVGFNLIAFCVYKTEYFTCAALALRELPFTGAVAYLAILSSVAAFLMYNFATANISLVQATSFSNIITVVSVAAGIIILREDFSVLQLVCCAAILTGVYFVNLPQGAKDNSNAQIGQNT